MSLIQRKIQFLENKLASQNNQQDGASVQTESVIDESEKTSEYNVGSNEQLRRREEDIQ